MRLVTRSYQSSLGNTATDPQAPAWAHLVDRWYQLDEICRSYCEAIHAWNYLADLQMPDLIFLMAKESSAQADIDFASSATPSPSRFVYTLPNIPASAILQMLKIQCKIYCFAGNIEIPKDIGKKNIWALESTQNSDGSRKVLLTILNRN